MDEALGATVVATCNEVGLDNHHAFLLLLAPTIITTATISPAAWIRQGSKGAVLLATRLGGFLLDQALITTGEGEPGPGQEAIKTGQFGGRSGKSGADPSEKYAGQRGPD